MYCEVIYKFDVFSIFLYSENIYHLLINFGISNKRNYKWHKLFLCTIVNVSTKSLYKHFKLNWCVFENDLIKNS